MVASWLFLAPSTVFPIPSRKAVVVPLSSTLISKVLDGVGELWNPELCERNRGKFSCVTPFGNEISPACSPYVQLGIVEKTIINS